MLAEGLDARAEVLVSGQGELRADSDPVRFTSTFSESGEVLPLCSRRVVSATFRTVIGCQSNFRLGFCF